ncbi:transmembrane protein 39A isoform X2 [Arctopsyche grandis]
MTPGNRRLTRSTRSTSTPLNADFPKSNFPNASTTQAVGQSDIPWTPRHIPFPNIPHDGDLLFELMTFIFTALAAGAQFLNLYRTVWWLPHSFTSQTMNFYLIDFHVVLFILIVLGRRLLFILCSSALRNISPTKFLPAVLRVLNITILTIVMSALGWCIYHLFPKHPILSIFFLCYPASVYLLLFGMHGAPFIQLDVPGYRPPHCCANGAPAIRNEVEMLKADFNQRLKQIIFSSLVGAYYAGFVPWCFAQHFLHYDVYRIIRHLALVWLGLFTQHAAHCLSARYCDHLHRAALHLGRWELKGSASTISLTHNPISSGSSSLTSGFPSSTSPIGLWCHKRLWAAGSVVRYGKWTYTSVGCMTAAEPGNLMHLRFHILFYNPYYVMCMLLCLQMSLVVMLLVFLMYTTEWHFILSLALLLFSNYYTLFKLIRDYLVSLKVYQTEFLIQEKHSTSPT